jgi:hypothetical protein
MLAIMIGAPLRGKHEHCRHRIGVDQHLLAKDAITQVIHRGRTNRLDHALHRVGLLARRLR